MKSSQRYHLHVKMENATYLRVTSSPEIEEALHAEFGYYVDGYETHPRYQSGEWDGIERLYNISTKRLPFGLLPRLGDLCRDMKWRPSMCPRLTLYTQQMKARISNTEIRNLISEVLDRVQYTDIKARDYQQEAAIDAIVRKRVLIQSPTGSGKSFIMYIMAMFYAMRFPKMKVCIIVPLKDLVEQIYNEFVYEYGGDEDLYHRVIPGKTTPHTDKPITITTWHSLGRLLKEDPKFFSRFGCLMVDEAHNADGATLLKIMNQSVNAFDRFGFSGSYKGSKCSENRLIGAFGGPKLVTATTQELIQRKILSEAQIIGISMDYTQEEMDHIRDMSYLEEIAFLREHKARTKFIAKSLCSTPGNVLALSRDLKHLKMVKEEIEAIGGKHVAILNGSSPKKVREEAKKLMETGDDIIILSTYHLMSTGINIKKIHAIAFIMGAKSTVWIRQSIGRGLRLHRTKRKLLVLDFIDNFIFTHCKTGRRRLKNPKQKAAYKHAAVRREVYDDDGFPIRYISHKLPDGGIIEREV